MSVTLLQGDCLQLLRDIPPGSVDMVLADLPFGTTRNAWDTMIPLPPPMGTVTARHKRKRRNPVFRSNAVRGGTDHE